MSNLRKKINGLLKMIGIIFLYIFLQVSLGYYYKDLLASSNLFISSSCNILIYILIILIISLFFVYDIVKDIKNFKIKYLKVGLSNWVKGFFAMLGSNIILKFLVIGKMASNETSNRELLLSNPVMSIILMVVLAPILEEIVFRLNIKKHIKNKWVFMILSGLLFGLIHTISSTSLIEVLYFIPYGLLGFFFAKAYYETDNFYTSALCHMIHNAFAIFIIILGGVL